MPFIRQVLRLQRYARNLLLREPNAWTGFGVQPSRPGIEASYLLLSNEEGGFARSGFWMQHPDGLRLMASASYVDLVVTETSLESGNFEEIFPHELAHSLLEELVGTLGDGPSRKMHMSMTVTDYPTAFAEGFAEHFQPLVRDATRNPHLLQSAHGMGPAGLASSWHSRIDQQMRTDGVKRNLFAYRKALPDSALESDSDRYQVYVDGETSTAFLSGVLKNGQEMMACEGVIATLFYRIVNDDRLRNHYRERRFYERFLPSGCTMDAAAPQVFNPYENINLKLFAALHAMDAEPLDLHRPAMIELLRTYAAMFPDESEPLFEIFLKTTWGVTVCQAVAGMLEHLTHTGRFGDLAAFRELLPSATRVLNELLEDVVAGRAGLDANLGPELWILNAGFRIPEALWERDRKLPLSLNLNTASEAELLTLPGVNLDLARRVVKSRREVGFFGDLKHLFRSAALPLALQDSLSAMSEQMRCTGNFHRR